MQWRRGRRGRVERWNVRLDGVARWNVANVSLVLMDAISSHTISLVAGMTQNWKLLVIMYPSLHVTCKGIFTIG